MQRENTAERVLTLSDCQYVFRRWRQSGFRVYKDFADLIPVKTNVFINCTALAPLQLTICSSTHNAFPINHGVDYNSLHSNCVCFSPFTICLTCVHSCLLCLSVTLQPHFYFPRVLQRYSLLVCHERERERESHTHTHANVFFLCCTPLRLVQ